MKRFIIVAAALLGVGFSGQAFAAVAVTAAGGLQGYTGQLNSALRTGTAWGLTTDIQGDRPLGLELSYRGASAQLFGSGSLLDGPREARVHQQGGDVMAHVSLARNNTVQVEPFLAAGLGVTHFQLSNAVPGFKNDIVGEIPVGAGLNYHPVSNMNVGLRGDYNFFYSDQFAPTNQKTDYGIFQKQGGDSWRGLVTVGGNF